MQFLYIHETGKADFVDGKMIFLQGSPVGRKHGIKFGRLSELAHLSQIFAKRMPSWETNCGLGKRK
jgi:hypothetical protein